VEQAFRWAHEGDPYPLLFYNEAVAEGMNRKSDAVYSMAKDFKARGVDGVGLQMHISNLDFETAPVAANIARFTAWGVQLHITGLDVSVSVGSRGEPLRKENLLRQAEIYRAVVNTCQNSGCTAIQTWGFTDKYSWIGSHSHPPRGAALPFRSYQPNPACSAIREQLLAGPASQ